MNRDKASLLDIVNSGKRVLFFAEGLDKSELEKNEEKQSAILYQVIVMGEATKRLSPDFREQHSEIPWKDIAGMRDILAHQYDKINFQTLWDVITKDIPELLGLLESLTKEITETLDDN